MSIPSEVQGRLERLEVPFNKDGVDPYGVSRHHLSRTFSILGFFYRHYFSVRVRGVEHVPLRGRAMLVGNHSGGVALDALMVISACFFEMEPPRLAQGMAEKFISRLPFASPWTNMAGHFAGLPEHAVRFLRDDRLLLVFPEGSRGTAKLYKERHSLVRFGSGFVRLALATKTPIVPFAFVGGGEAIPTVTNLYSLGKLVGAPYIPLTPYLLPLPLPAKVAVCFGEPLRLDGTGNEDDTVIESWVETVRDSITGLIETGRDARRGRT